MCSSLVSGRSRAFAVVRLALTPAVDLASATQKHSIFFLASNKVASSYGQRPRLVKREARKEVSRRRLGWRGPSSGGAGGWKAASRQIMTHRRTGSLLSQISRSCFLPSRTRASVTPRDPSSRERLFCVSLSCATIRRRLPCVKAAVRHQIGHQHASEECHKM